MKEKYFPTGSFLSASVGRNSSYAWRSIIQAREVLEKEMVLRVGNGESIDVWRDRWLPNPPSNKIHSPVGLLDSKSTVSNLINQSIGEWDYPLIQTSFAKFEADSICSLPLCSLNQPDRLIWSGTQHGCFTVRSAYHMEMTNRSQSRGECSYARDQTAVWKTIWSLGVSVVVKNFAWKVGNNLLPTKELLVQRHIGQDPYCPFCLLSTESICHILWECPSCCGCMAGLHLHNSEVDIARQSWHGFPPTDYCQT